MYPSRIASLCVAGAAACVIASASACWAQNSSGGSAPPAGSSLQNPNTSVIGWFQGEAGDRTKQIGTEAFQLKEAEIGRAHV